jgi:outer membrane murein-binding lipoprotein Lpp
MKRRKTMKKYILIGTSLLLVIGLLAGCGGVKQEDLDAANAAKNAAQAQVTTLQNEVDTLQNQLDAASAAQSQAEANKAIARRFAQVWAPGNLAIVDELRRLRPWSPSFTLLSLMPP